MAKGVMVARAPSIQIIVRLLALGLVISGKHKKRTLISGKPIPTKRTFIFSDNQTTFRKRLAHPIMNLESEITIVLNAKTDQSDMGNVMEILGYGQDDFQKAFDIALEMQNRNLVKLLYSNFNANKVIVEFTLLGRVK